MRTTVNIEKRLLADAKQVAGQEGKTLGEIVEDALRADLARRRRGGARKPSDRVVTYKGNGLCSRLGSANRMIGWIPFVLADPGQAGSIHRPMRPTLMLSEIMGVVPL